MRHHVYLAGMIAIGLCVGTVQAAPPAPAPAPAANENASAMAPARPKGGYLGASGMVDSVALVPPPPAEGSAAQARDLAASQAALALANGPRWQLATSDAELFRPGSTAALSCAAGIAISPQATPALDRLLTRSAYDLGMSTGAAKKAYSRPRPFMLNGKPSCTPGFEAALSRDGSYPSGHSAIGYGWGLILAELIPARASRLVARGRAYGESRRICNVHWLSDVEEGRTVAAATLAAMHANPEFQADMAAARAELAAATQAPPDRDCQAEDAALALDVRVSGTSAAPAR